ncbi:MAG: sugar phosphate isomerase/epimerase [Candidatus Methanoplasma sp.]|jgi:sugar phosphate isomerase/epimerase|nr:sugar phosphate isomerase/epimerase [Candidatus Methanoplasma sp.]
MKHLLNYSVCQPLCELPRGGEGLKDIGCDGIELFVLFERVPQEYRCFSPSVHLPFAIDWYSGWTGRADTEEFDEDNVRYVMFGRDREEIADNIRSAIAYASEIEPAYAVLHASNTNLDEVMFREQTDNSREILGGFCEMMNQTVAGFRGNEPPVKLAFENLWWPGLKLLDRWEYEFMASRLEFDNWGFCLDTGHMMNTLPDAYEEQTCVDRLLEIFERYPDDMKERIGTVHLHASTSAGYRNSFEPRERPPGETMQETISRSYPHIKMIDQHKPFSSGGCRLLIDELSPDFVTHEMMGSSTEDTISDFIRQRSHFEDRESDSRRCL